MTLAIQRDSPLAVAAAQTGLSLLAADHDVRAAPVGLVDADALTVPVDRFPVRPDRGYDLVIGNPPFGGQLRGPTRRGTVEQTAIGSAVKTDLHGKFKVDGIPRDKTAHFFFMLDEKVEPEIFKAPPGTDQVRLVYRPK